MPGTVFRHWGGEAAEVLRPDVTLGPMPFLDYPGVVEDLLAHHPELTDLLRAYLLDGALSVSELQSLATTRPVLIELDPRVPPAVYETLVPAGALYEVLADGATETDERDRAQAQDEMLSALGRRLSDAIEKDPETKRELLWTNYMAALYFAGFGDLPHARSAAARALSIAPTEPALKRLSETLATAIEGEPIDVRPFFPDASGP